MRRAARGRQRAVFVSELALVDCPFDDVARRLETRLEEVLGAALVDTRDESEQHRRKVAPTWWPDALAKSVLLRAGPVRRQPAGLLVAFSWEPTGAGALFPSLEADIEVAPIGTSETSLTLRGRYEPPAGSLGRRLDDLVLHRVAAWTVRAFLDSVRDHLEPPRVPTFPDGEHRG